MFVANGRGTEEIRRRTNLALSIFSHLQSSLWSWRKIPLSTKGRVYQAVGRSILLYGCETWLVRVAYERMLEVLDNDSIRRILRVRHRDCVPSVELRRRLSLISIPALLVQRRLRWLGHAARRPDGEPVKDLLLPTPPRTYADELGASWRGGQPRSRPAWNRFPDRESSAMHDGERTVWKCLVSSHRTAEPGVAVTVLIVTTCICLEWGFLIFLVDRQFYVMSTVSLLAIMMKLCIYWSG